MNHTIRSPWMDSELDAVRDLARTFFAKEVTPHEERFAQQGYPEPELYQRAGDLGLMCMSVPEAYGGGGGSFLHEAVLLEEQARAGNFALQFSVGSGIVPHYLLAYGAEEQKQRWLPKLASGEWVGAIAMTEPGAGSDLQRISATAVRDGDDYVINGAKTFISSGRNCRLLIIAAKTGPAQGAAGISLIVAEVDDDTPGFVRGRILNKIGQKGQDTTELFFDDLRVPVANLLGPGEGQGFRQLMSQLPQERLIVALNGVVVIERAIELTLEYTQQRHAFGNPLFSLQNTRFELADCAAIARVARVFVDDCITRHLKGELTATEAAMAKLWVTDQQCAVVDRCLQLYGGYGYMSEFPISHIFVDSRVQRIYAGANEVMKELIARSL